MAKKNIFIVAGEHSGDLAGAGLIAAVKKIFPQAHFTGIAGPEMIAAGCEPLFSSEKLAVMGFVIGQLHEIWQIRRAVIQRCLSDPPDLFIGIDAPDFNLGVECRLKAAGITTVHYVSPSIWAWRGWRIKKIARAVDLMLTLFPFETAIYDKANIPVKCVGHPLADRVPMYPNKKMAREKLSLPQEQSIIALLPGSRAMEIQRLGTLFLAAAKQCLAKQPNLHFIVPMVNQVRQDQFTTLIKAHAPELPITIFLNNSLDVITASDVVITACGTATLEIMLAKRPMVAAYRVGLINYLIAKCLVDFKHAALPNTLAEEEEPVIPVLLQSQVTPERLADEALAYLDDHERTERLVKTFERIHETLRKNAHETAAEAIIELLNPFPSLRGA